MFQAPFCSALYWTPNGYRGLIPRNTGWLELALSAFSNHPRLAMLGGFQGFESFDPDPAKAKRLWGGGQFRFVHHVNIGPYFIRRQSYEALGGWEYSFSGHSLFGGAAGFWGTLTKCGGQLSLVSSR